MSVRLPSDAFIGINPTIREEYRTRIAVAPVLSLPSVSPIRAANQASRGNSVFRQDYAAQAPTPQEKQ
jgi:hypothetical protein